MPSEPPNLHCRPTHRAPVTDISVWLECYSRMAAIIVTHFPEKAPELWAYQATILRAAQNYEGTAWVAYDRQFRREARKDLNWSVTHPRLYIEAFTGRAKAIPRCPHCLSENHVGLHCLVNPNPPLVGWFPDARQLQLGMHASPPANRRSVVIITTTGAGSISAATCIFAKGALGPTQQFPVHVAPHPQWPD